MSKKESLSEFLKKHRHHTLTYILQEAKKIGLEEHILKMSVSNLFRVTEPGRQ